ncbi:MAG: anthranilate synthase component II [Bacteroidota bacterium]
MRILLFDNYDSFTYNLLHMLEAVSAEVKVEVIRNDESFTTRWSEFDRVVISPGPGLPEESGGLMHFIETVAGKIPVLGVCLGHQAIISYFGGRLLNLENVLHGKSCPTEIVDKTEVLFKGLPERIMTGHYHSWVADPSFFPEKLTITAKSPEGHIMAFRHKELEMAGVQFHPESILTPQGASILTNWINS